MFKLLMGLSAITGIAYFGTQIAKDTAAKIWELISFSVPAGSTKVKIGITNILLTTAIKLDNANNISVQVAGLHAIAKYKNKEGQLVEVGRTEPNSKVWTIGARQSTIIDNIQINAGTIGTITALANAIKQPEGSRLMITFSGTINGLSLSYDYWY
jgi:hypothetical protein